MVQAVADQNPIVAKQIFVQAGKSVELEGFYKSEARFLDYLYSLDTGKAQQEIRGIIDYVNNNSLKNSTKGT